MLASVAEFYEEDVQTALSAAMALIEPLILVVMAVFVGGILISLVYADLYLGSAGALDTAVERCQSAANGTSLYGRLGKGL